MPADDLWPDTAFQNITAAAPVQILREQATALTNRTRGLLRGSVVSAADAAQLQHQLNVEVPSLDYAAALIRVRHPVSRLFPATVQIVTGTSPVTIGMASNDVAFRAYLKKALANERVTRLLATLLAQGSK